MKFETIEQAIIYYRDSIDKDDLKMLIDNSLQSSQDYEDWTDVNDGNLVHEFIKFILEHSELPTNEQELDECDITLDYEELINSAIDVLLYKYDELFY